MESKKYNKLVNITKKKQTTDIENKLAVTGREREGGRDSIGVGGLEVQTIRYKISYKDIFYNTGTIANIF